MSSESAKKQISRKRRALFAIFHISGVIALIAVCTLYTSEPKRNGNTVCDCGTGEVRVQFVLESSLSGMRYGSGALYRDGVRGVCGYAVLHEEGHIFKQNLQLRIRSRGAPNHLECSINLQTSTEAPQFTEDGREFSGCQPEGCEEIWKKCTSEGVRTVAIRFDNSEETNGSIVASVVYT